MGFEEVGPVGYNPASRGALTMAVTKTIDSKGRLNLGQQYANRHVIIEQVDPTELRIQMARVIPEREAWLLENTAARDSVLRGIEQAKRKDFVKGPEL